MKLYSSRRGFPHRVHCRRLSPLSTQMRSLRRELLFWRCSNETSSWIRPNATPGVLIAASYYYGAPYYYGAYYGVPYYRRYDAPYSMGVRILGSRLIKATIQEQ